MAEQPSVTRQVLKWQCYRTIYGQVSALDQNRLTANAFLGGVSIAAFATLATAPLPTPLDPYSPTIRSVVATALAISSLLFLSAAYTAYQVLRRVYLLSPDNTRALRDNLGTDPFDLGTDEAILDEAMLIHLAGSTLITLGFIALTVALIGTSLWFDPYVVAGIVVVGVYLGWRYRLVFAWAMHRNRSNNRGRSMADRCAWRDAGVAYPCYCRRSK